MGHPFAFTAEWNILLPLASFIKDPNFLGIKELFWRGGEVVVTSQLSLFNLPELFLDEAYKPSVSVHSLAPIIFGAKSLNE